MSNNWFRSFARVVGDGDVLDNEDIRLLRTLLHDPPPEVASTEESRRALEKVCQLLDRIEEQYFGLTEVIEDDKEAHNALRAAIYSLRPLEREVHLLSVEAVGLSLVLLQEARKGVVEDQLQENRRKRATLEEEWREAHNLCDSIFMEHSNGF